MRSASDGMHDCVANLSSSVKNSFPTALKTGPTELGRGLGGGLVQCSVLTAYCPTESSQQGPSLALKTCRTHKVVLKAAAFICPT